ncbi:MAG: maleylpyruvate isomerase family mycothiol-dependent enzyme [Actinomycetota bacterium]|nr:maleylpyruvate isomerase family mycothiol-dependent enzyme [Actinomycetota bacterium]
MVPLNDIQEATHRLVRTVDDMSDEDFAAASLLPDWSRAHVVAHLTLNAEGLAGALTGITRGRSVPMYASPEERDDDIAELATAPPRILRTRLLGATSEFAAAMEAVPADAWGTHIERTPGGPTFVAGAVPGMREREVEIHHADLALAYSPSDWPPAFTERLLEAMSNRDRPQPFSVYATDLDRTWRCGTGGDGGDGMTVSGTSADLGWWLTGRGDGEGLTSDNGTLPGIEEW